MEFLKKDKLLTYEFDPKERFLEDGAYAECVAKVKKAGVYTLKLYYHAGDEDSAPQSIHMTVGGKCFQQMVASMRDEAILAEAVITVELPKGKQKIRIEKTKEDTGDLSIERITLRKVEHKRLGKVLSVEQRCDTQVVARCENGDVLFQGVMPNVVKIWADPERSFSRLYASFAVANEEKHAQQLTLHKEKHTCLLDAGEVKLSIKVGAPFALSYLNKEGKELLATKEEGFSWTEDGELLVRHKLSKEEQFWGLGEKLTSFAHRGRKYEMWAVDAYGSECDSSFSQWEHGRWYMANPYFVSSKGYSIFFDNTSRTVFDLGFGKEDEASFGSANPNPGGELIYYFIYGPTPKQLTKSFTDLTGKSFFAPKYAYGNIQCHYGYHQDDVERVAAKYREEHIPLDAMMCDIEWYEYLCTPTKWSKKNFPDPDKMIAFLKDNHLRLGVINDPNITDRDNNEDYVAGDKAGYFVQDKDGKTKQITWPWGAASGLVDFFDPAARKWWGTLLDGIIKQGVECFWLDMNEPSRYNTDWRFSNPTGGEKGTLNQVKNAYAIGHQQAVFDKVTEDGKRAFLLTRSGFTGTQRYASPWTGDIRGTYESLHEQIMLGTGLSMSGYHYWGFDIGGFFDTVDNNLYARWMELATFTPVHRFHYCEGVEEKEPYTHNGTELAKKYIGLRYRLFPYFYSYTADSILGIGIEKNLGEGGSGIPTVRPLVMEFPEDEKTYTCDTQFMCGQSFLIAPILTKETKRQVYLPEGDWYDYWNPTEVYHGPCETTYPAPVDVLPIFVKAGSIIPMQSEREYMEDPAASPDITLEVYAPMEDGEFEFVLYDDDGQTNDYEKGIYATTRISCKKSGYDLIVTVHEPEGSFKVDPRRKILVNIHRPE